MTAENRVMKDKKSLKTDMILIGALLLTGVVIACVLLLTAKPGKTAVIRVEGQVVKELPLDRDTEYIIESAGGGRNVLIIEDGSVRVSEADCPDELCVHMGKINRSGQSIICLPHKVVIEILAGDDPKDSDVDVYVK